jgi:hypothetical protein
MIFIVISVLIELRAIEFIMVIKFTIFPLILNLFEFLKNLTKVDYINFSFIRPTISL